MARVTSEPQAMFRLSPEPFFGCHSLNLQVVFLFTSILAHFGMLFFYARLLCSCAQKRNIVWRNPWRKYLVSWFVRSDFVTDQCTAAEASPPPARWIPALYSKSKSGIQLAICVVICNKVCWIPSRCKMRRRRGLSEIHNFFWLFSSFHPIHYWIWLYQGPSCVTSVWGHVEDDNSKYMRVKQYIFQRPLSL